MKYLIFSDLHGSADSAKQMIDVFLNEKCDQMICLGDVLYHGPRNDLPEFYAPKQVITILNSYAKHILCIQGNCDAEVEQMVLNFNLYKKKNIKMNGTSCHLEHGHHLQESEVEADVVLYGHTHIPQMEWVGHTLYLNPGSITIPKNRSKRSYMIWDKNKIWLYSIDGHLIQEIDIK
ncbi:MAG: phosphodiesterase [Anaeroplasmataceae bacterium]|nr:phosphodiesterase [Anaeroplasmataceae bacterium]